MITLKEVLKGAKLEDQPEDVRANLAILIAKVNKIREAYGKPMTVTSGLRTMADHLRIYREKAEKAGVPFDESKVPMKSQHLKGAALDISDPNQELQAWCLANVSTLEQAGLWCESFSATPNWVHFQIFAPRSGNRFFNP
jgi:uncharacterized protein YcbK (DUF882 family)